MILVLGFMAGVDVDVRVAEAGGRRSGATGRVFGDRFEYDLRGRFCESGSRSESVAEFALAFRPGFGRGRGAVSGS